jgi:hypothetical protein
MCRNPFGKRFNNNKGEFESNPRFDKIDDILKIVMNGNTDPEYAIFAAALLKDIHNYLYWSLGDNKCTDVKWQDAYDYLFVIQGDKPETWGKARIERSVEHTEDNRRITHKVPLTDEDMKRRTFDAHYELLRLQEVLPISSFRRLLKERRAEILRQNREQVEDYLRSERVRELENYPDGSQMRISFYNHDLIKTLTSPESMQQVAELVLGPVPAPPRPCRTPRRRLTQPRKKPLCQGTEEGLFEKYPIADRNADHDSQRVAGHLVSVQTS